MRYGLCLAMLAMLVVCGCRQREVQPWAGTVGPVPRTGQPPSPGGEAIPVSDATPADDETPAHFLAGAFDLPEGEITVTEKEHRNPALSLPGKTYTCTHGGEEYQIRTIAPGVWSVMNRTRLKDQGQTSPSAAQAKKAAQAVLQRRWGDRAAEMTVDQDKPLPSGPYSLTYRVVVAPDVLTGDDAAVMVGGDGKLISYNEHRAQRQVRYEEVKLTREEAIAKAQAIMEARYEPKPKLKLLDAKLILSSHLHPQKGPLWSVKLGMLNSIGGRPETVTAADGVFVDAMTGKEVKLPGLETR